jgi:hypothetical protein
LNALRASAAPLALPRASRRAHVGVAQLAQGEAATCLGLGDLGGCSCFLRGFLGGFALDFLAFEFARIDALVDHGLQPACLGAGIFERPCTGVADRAADGLTVSAGLAR